MADTKIHIYDPDEEITMEFFEYIKYRMDKYGITQKFMQNETGIDQSNFSKMLRGKKKVSLHMAHRLCKAVGGKFKIGQLN